MKVVTLLGRTYIIASSDWLDSGLRRNDGQENEATEELKVRKKWMNLFSLCPLLPIPASSEI